MSKIKGTVLTMAIILSIFIFSGECRAATKYVTAKVSGFSGSAKTGTHSTAGIVSNKTGLRHELKCFKGKVKSGLYYYSSDSIMVGSTLSITYDTKEDKNNAKEVYVNPDYSTLIYGKIETKGIGYDTGTMYIFDYSN